MASQQQLLSMGTPPTFTSEGAWNPSSLGTDVWSWWKFDGMSEGNGVAVSSVADTSGNSRTLTVLGAPTAKTGAQNGKKALDFAAGQTYCTFASMSALTSGSIFGAIKSGASPSDTNVGGFVDTGTDTQVNHYTYGGQVYCDFLSSGRKSAGVVTVNVWHQVLFWSATNDWGHAMNGTDQYTTGSNTVAGNATSYLASDAGFASWRLKGELGEVVILQNKPSTLNRQKMEGYLAWRWGLVTALPGGHPYKSAPP